MIRTAVFVSVLALVCADRSLDATRDARLLFFPTALMGASNSLFRSGLEKDSGSVARTGATSILDMITSSLDTLLFLPTCERPVVKAVLDTCDLITNLPASQEHDICKDFVSEELKGYFSFPADNGNTCAFQINTPKHKNIVVSCKNMDATTFVSFNVFESITKDNSNEITADPTSSDNAKTWTSGVNSVYIEYQGTSGTKPVIECSWDTVDGA